MLCKTLYLCVEVCFGFFPFSKWVCIGEEYFPPSRNWALILFNLSVILEASQGASAELFLTSADPDGPQTEQVMGKAAASKRERRKGRLMAAGKPPAAGACSVGEAGRETKGTLRRFQTAPTWGLLSTFSSGWIQVSLSPLATVSLVFQATTSKGATETLASAEA